MKNQIGFSRFWSYCHSIIVDCNMIGFALTIFGNVANSQVEVFKIYNSVSGHFWSAIIGIHLWLIAVYQEFATKEATVHLIWLDGAFCTVTF